MIVIFSGILFLTSKFNKYSVDKKLTNEGAIFQYLLKEKGVLFQPDTVIDYLDLVSENFDVIVFDPQTKNPVYFETDDTSFIFNNARVLTNLIKEEKLEKNIFITIRNKRLMIGTLLNENKSYIYIVVKDISGNNSYLSALAFIFIVLLFLSIIWNYYNTNNIMSNILKGIDEITDSAKNIKGKNLSERIDTTSSDESISNLIFTLNSMLNRVEKSFVQINEFTDNVSHELKTPITSIKSMIEVELSQERTVEEYQEDLGKILDEINWLNGIIKKLLIFTKNPEDLERHFKPIKIENMIIDLCEFMEILTFEKEITLKCELEDNGIEVLGDEPLLRDVFLNLISNAIKYNKINGKINITSIVTDDKIGIQISDTGVGIKKENIEKITVRFFREDTVRTTKKSGSGLGLSIVSHLIEVHKGTLEIESIEGVGSQFTIFLPRI